MTKKYRIIAALATAVCALSLCGCGLLFSAPKTVTIGGEAYATGFYGNLYCGVTDFSDDTCEVNGTKYLKIQDASFDMYCATVGASSVKTVYCKESQLEAAQAFYSAPANFNFFCSAGITTKDSDPELINLSSDVDAEMFDRLIAFAEQNGYDPFNSAANDKVEKVELPMPDEETSPKLLFHKESKDGVFVSGKSTECHIIDGELILVFYYDHGFGEYEKLVGVKVPQDISDYFTDLLKQYCL